MSALEVNNVEITGLNQYMHFMGTAFGEGLAALVLNAGRLYPKSVARKAERRWIGKKQQCFMNAGRMVTVSNDDDLRYAEGWAWFPNCPIPVLHGFVVTADGHVIEPSPTELANEYFGVVFDTRFYRQQLLRQQYWGLLDPIQRETVEYLRSLAKVPA